MPTRQSYVLWSPTALEGADRRFQGLSLELRQLVEVVRAVLYPGRATSTVPDFTNDVIDGITDLAVSLGLHFEHFATTDFEQTAARVWMIGEIIRGRLLLESIIHEPVDHEGILTRGGICFEALPGGLKVSTVEQDAGPGFLAHRDLERLGLMRYPRPNLPPSTALCRILSAYSLGPRHWQTCALLKARPAGISYSGLAFVATRYGVDVWVDDYHQPQVLVPWPVLFRVGLARDPLGMAEGSA